MSNKTTFEKILTWMIVGILAIVALKIVATVLGIAFVLGGFLFRTVLPVVLVVWLVMKAIQWMSDKDRRSTTPGSTF